MSEGPEDVAALKAKHERFVKYLNDNSVNVREVADGKLIAYVCVVEAAKYKEISVETKKYYPKSVCEITEYMIINKSVVYFYSESQHRRN